MPGKAPIDLLEVGGKSTDLGRKTFLERVAETRKRILAEKPVYVDVTNVVMEAEYRGSTSRPVIPYGSGKSRAKGNKMPKKTSNLNSVTTIAGKRGRKAEFLNIEEWKFGVGIEHAIDVSDEMNSGIEAYIAKNECDAFDSDTLFGTDNADANKYRAARFAAFKRVAIQANGEKAKFELNSAVDSSKNRVWVLVRTA